MPADFTNLNTSLTALTDEVTATEAGNASTIVFIQGVGQRMSEAVTAALTADAAANQTTIDAANAAITDLTNRLVATASTVTTALAA